MHKRTRLLISGRVQGVGFRPSVYRLATSLSLSGFVKNTPSGVTIEIQGPADRLDQFQHHLSQSIPTIAKITALSAEELPVIKNSSSFAIDGSERSGDLFFGMPVDMAICESCLKELLTPSDRRFNYPFINCTECGPRYSIIDQLPYDRPYTAMAEFTMCPSCRLEYEHPDNRRFDAQPIACPDCGPVVQLIDSHGTLINSSDPVHSAAELIKSGKIIAIKGLGGYQICCDAKNESVIHRLRERKHRPHKALAVMFSSLTELRQYCSITKDDQKLLTSRAAPIVIVKPGQVHLPSSISPDTPTIGAFLPYTPLHVLLLNQKSPLIMTSANISDEPIIINEKELQTILGTIVDYALIHNRPIRRRVDDSLVAIAANRPVLLRRARGFVPETINLPNKSQNILACGSDLKNTFGLSKNNLLYLSQHIGDLKDHLSFNFYEEQITDLLSLLKVTPEIIAYDKHPDYLSSRYAGRFPNAHHIRVQHHHAHIAAVMAEHGLTQPVIGIALDGTGYGDDGYLWGGEFLVADLISFKRHYHLDYHPMPGNEQAIYHPSRMALSYLYRTFPRDKCLTLAGQYLPDITPTDAGLLLQLIDGNNHITLTSSMGRLFDAVSALLGFNRSITYEGQAAIRLEALIDNNAEQIEPYPFSFDNKAILLNCLITAIVTDLEHQVPKNTIALKFHQTIITMVNDVCQKLSAQTGIKAIALSGGVFQNNYLLSNCIKTLSNQGFLVYSHHIVPPNDGGLALGQAAIAAAHFSKE